MNVKVTARVVVNVEIHVNDADSENEASERVSGLELSMPGWDDHEHSVVISELEITSTTGEAP